MIIALSSDLILNYKWEMNDSWPPTDNNFFKKIKKMVGPGVNKFSCCPFLTVCVPIIHEFLIRSNFFVGIIEGKDTFYSAPTDSTYFNCMLLVWIGFKLLLLLQYLRPEQEDFISSRCHVRCKFKLNVVQKWQVWGNIKTEKCILSIFSLTFLFYNKYFNIQNGLFIYLIKLYWSQHLTLQRSFTILLYKCLKPYLCRQYAFEQKLENSILRDADDSLLHKRVIFLLTAKRDNLLS